ncbi:MAG TPA: Ni-sirohydrochlorin a,c-diamide reductive cyclase catalytic subunit [Methanofastidiosum sp.]|jgi:putative methanogenesis marker 13 metalloprotein|nr:Ni-sirohydrochlorin a,c-diamide reductive cyclase catalytic subunit [Methanofastidiosum sp.]HOC77851.1 Ni-sirohydrochlorin a,c-diamide reductive cyclase catalytic subunit [Methanofastidiosum sp.]HOG73455.1 Ni-sirohydrochlorin a,c-diamide reductive cyclase catalytic subunit [Methanofastidiosum sp.]HQQ48426.1 Ni-sirohydrochlorin a,c-diamide reductive cyclase catalytic subunit [Methanofastidiosum sp.]HRZ19866.1 Ni-sirohydrochlorin a,c-diamide reductive cyclase catalytic subunit [Methanofastidio
MNILTPRPNPIVAALYTLRDLDVDVAVLHGPSGCGFRAARLLEEDGMKVVTTSMSEEDLIFGASDKLIEVLKEVDELFSPKMIGVVGSCVSMIIGENVKKAIIDSGLKDKAFFVEIHGCMGANTRGAIETLKSAMDFGLIDQHEFQRQEKMLLLATEVESNKGMAKSKYTRPSRGDELRIVAEYIINCLKENKKIAVILNAKKETAYLFADIPLAINLASKKFGGQVINVGNLSTEVGLTRIKRYANDIRNNFEKNNITIDHISGGVDEYPVAGKDAIEYLKDKEYDLIVAVGIPQAVPKIGIESIAVTNGPREVEPLRDAGYKYVTVEIASHSTVMGTRDIVLSELGEAIRKAAGIQ